MHISILNSLSIRDIDHLYAAIARLKAITYGNKECLPNDSRRGINNHWNCVLPVCCTRLGIQGPADRSLPNYPYSIENAIGEGW